MASENVCPVVGTTNTVLPPSHPAVDLSKPGQTCPVVGARTEHHRILTKHPALSGSVEQPTTADDHAPDAQACPALKSVVIQPRSQQMDDQVCPVVGPVTTVLPPDHPSTAGKADDVICPVTRAQVGHHKGKLGVHPSLDAAAADAVCPVSGAHAH